MEVGDRVKLHPASDWIAEIKKNLVEQPATIVKIRTHGYVYLKFEDPGVQQIHLMLGIDRGVDDIDKGFSFDPHELIRI